MILRTSPSRLHTATSATPATLLLGALLLYLHLLLPQTTSANDIQIANGIVLPNDASSHLIEFDLSWQNSWRDNDLDGAGLSNWDAAWVFVKYREPVANGGDGLWKHAWLNNTGHTGPAGATIDTGLLDPSAAFNAATNPGLGVFVYRSGAGSGATDWDGLRLQWNFAEQGLTASSVVEIRLFAVEMVYVAQGAFAAGDGSIGFTLTTINTATATTAPSGSGSLGGQAGGYPTGQTAPGASWPNGYNAFYMMKYELSQQQYVDFLNTLSRAQQDARTATNLAAGVSAVSNRYVMSNSYTVNSRNGIRVDASIDANAAISFYCDLDGNGTGGQSNDGQWLACNYLSWMDGAAYMDWSGLRPMTELEYEKAGRGPAGPVANEYAWGSTGIANAAYSLANAGAASEAISANYNAAGNASSGTTDGAIDGPLRVGLFATGASSRAAAGASYWGIMELSGNLWERPVTIGNADGRAFTGAHGDGALSAAGHATTAGWPGLASGELTGAAGSGFRGGSWIHDSTILRLSDRNVAAVTLTNRNTTFGFRGVRAAAGG